MTCGLTPNTEYRVGKCRQMDILPQELIADRLFIHQKPQGTCAPATSQFPHDLGASLTFPVVVMDGTTRRPRGPSRVFYTWHPQGSHGANQPPCEAAVLRLPVGIRRTLHSRTLRTGAGLDVVLINIPAALGERDLARVSCYLRLNGGYRANFRTFAGCCEP